MQLIPCPKCGKKIPSSSVNCLNCDYPISTQKYCKFCCSLIEKNCIICPTCGKQVEEFYNTQNNTVLTNNQPIVPPTSTYRYGKPKNKWISLFLCLFTICGHKFYEGKTGIGFLYLLTMGLFGIGWIIDIFILLLKPNPYYV